MAGDTKMHKLETTKMVNEWTNKYYDDLYQLRLQGKPAAWVIGQMPYELFLAMDIPFLQWENVAIRTVNRKGEGQFKKTSEAYGFNSDVCSYSRIATGCALLGEADPSTTTIERPDLLLPKPSFITMSQPCPAMGYWFEATRRIFKVPTFAIDLPTIYRPYDKDEVEKAVQYVEKQMLDYVHFLEEMTGRRMDWDRLKDIMKIIQKAATLRKEITDLNKNVPAPMSFFDALITLAPVNILRGRPETVEYFEKLKAEVEYRVANKIGAIPNERHRLYWDHIGVWYKVGELARRFASYGAVVLIGYYTNSILYHEPEYINPDKPMRTIAEALFIRMTLRNSSMPYKVDELVRLAEEFKLDGLIMHSSRTCRPMDFGQPDVIEAVRQRSGVRGLLIESDHCDPSYYDENSVNSALDSFFELLESDKKGVPA